MRSRGEGFAACLPEDPAAPLIYLIESADRADATLNAFEDAPFGVVALTDAEWNRDLSPWFAEKVFSQGGDFTGGAEMYLQKVTERIHEIERGRQPVWRGIAGYSLAGLFAVWALFACDAFERAASASGSMWFDGFTEFADAHEPKGNVQKVCFSLGDREHRARNPRMAKVAEATAHMVRRFEALNIPVSFRSEQGGHFNEPDQRVRRILCALSED